MGSFLSEVLPVLCRKAPRSMPGRSESYAEPQNLDCLQQPQRTQGVRICRVFGSLKGHLHTTLGSQIIYFVGLHLLHYPNKVCCVSQVSIMKFKPNITFIRIFMQMVNSGSVEKRCSPIYSMNNITFAKQELS